MLLDEVSRFVVAQRHNITKPRVETSVERVLAVAQDVPRNRVRVEVLVVA